MLDFSRGGAAVFEPRAWGNGTMGTLSWETTNGSSTAAMQCDMTAQAHVERTDGLNGLDSMMDLLHRQPGSSRMRGDGSVRPKAPVATETVENRWRWIRDLTDKELVIPLLDVKIKV